MLGRKRIAVSEAPIHKKKELFFLKAAFSVQRIGMSVVGAKRTGDGRVRREIGELNLRRLIWGESKGVFIDLNSPVFAFESYR